MRKTNALRRADRADTLVMGFFFLLLGLFFILCLVPFWMVLINSFATPQELVRGFSLLPSTLTLETYRYLFRHSTILLNFRNSVVITAIGTFLAVASTSMLAYGMAHPRVQKRYVLSFMTYIPMILGSGLVGFYLLMVRYLHLKDTYWAMILPYVVNPFYVFIMISFYRTIPYELIEAACVDGADDLRTFFQIVWPLSRVAVLTVTLFYALAYWNDWWLAMLFVNDTTLQPLQILIRNITSQQEMASIIGSMNAGAVQPVNVQLATVCLTIGPIVLLYPFLQKYFVKGIIVGAVKG
ncbi:MAG: carbohydrate ABC transporter permease [Aristaeellaceae bacterium]